jgi:hypothetical protein
VHAKYCPDQFVRVTDASDNQVSDRVISLFLIDAKSRSHAAASIRFGGKPPLALLGRSLL